MKQYVVYILSSKAYGTLYIGVSSKLKKRLYIHRNNLIKGFTQTYQVHKLVYYEIYNEAYLAIKREKQLKAWKRLWKIKLIENMNPKWIDLYDTL